MSYQDRLEKIAMKKQAQGVNDLYEKCRACGMVNWKHEAVQANRCKKRTDQSVSVEPAIRAKQNQLRGLDKF